MLGESQGRGCLPSGLHQVRGWHSQLMWSFRASCAHSSAAQLGEPEDTYRLRVLSPGKFVGVNGEVEVAATSGAWSQVATGRGGESFLRFFIDFPDGASRNDVELPTGRVFFTNGCWIGQELELAQTAVEQLQEELAELEAAPVFSEGANPLQKIFELPKAVNRDEKQRPCQGKTSSSRRIAARPKRGRRLSGSTWPKGWQGWRSQREAAEGTGRGVLHFGQVQHVAHRGGRGAVVVTSWLGRRRQVFENSIGS